jgi:hypothetical protein
VVVQPVSGVPVVTHQAKHARGYQDAVKTVDVATPARPVAERIVVLSAMNVVGIFVVGWV